MKEQFKPIVGYENRYLVSNFGRIYSNIRSKFLSPSGIRNNNTPYLSVLLMTPDSKVTNRKIHRLVAEAFIPNPENRPEVNHLDGDKHNNRADNLEWATRQENIDHSFDVLKRRNRSSKTKAKRILYVTKDSTLIRIPSCSELCLELTFNKYLELRSITKVADILLCSVTTVRARLVFYMRSININIYDFM